jgi:hypothetical protein
MSVTKKPNTRRGEMGFIFAIIIGLALGILVKRVRLGILLGLVIGFVIVFLGWTRVNNKNDA